MLEYHSTRNCDLHVVPDTFNSASYGIALPNGADYEEELSNLIIKLGENGALNELEQKWWPKQASPPRDAMYNGWNDYETDVLSTGPLAPPFARSLGPLTHSLAPLCSLRLRAPLRSFVC